MRSSGEHDAGRAVVIVAEQPVEPAQVGQRHVDPGRSWLWGRQHPVDLVAISSRAVALGADCALETLIHEMVHYRNNRHGLIDCTNAGCYHNRHFRDAAILVGLVCGEPRDATYGYGLTRLGPHARRAIDRLHPHEKLFCAARAEPEKT